MKDSHRYYLVILALLVVSGLLYFANIGYLSIFSVLLAIFTLVYTISRNQPSIRVDLKDLSLDSWSLTALNTYSIPIALHLKDVEDFKRKKILLHSQR